MLTLYQATSEDQAHMYEVVLYTTPYKELAESVLNFVLGIPSIYCWRYRDWKERYKGDYDLSFYRGYSQILELQVPDIKIDKKITKFRPNIRLDEIILVTQEGHQIVDALEMRHLFTS